MTIRPETPKDFSTIHALIKDAFQTAKVKDGDEQDFARALRRSANYIPALALVAEDDDGRIVGHIMLTRTRVEQFSGLPYAGLLLEPLSVDKRHQGRGIGRALVNHALLLAGQMGYAAVFLCGDVDYYARFGFKPLSYYGLGSHDIRHLPHALACELTPGALSEVAGGTVDCWELEKAAVCA